MRKKYVPYVLIIPLVAAFIILIGFPLFNVLETSFYKATFLNPSARTYVGFDNYAWLFNFKLYDPNFSLFVSALGRSALWVALSVIIKVFVGILAAVLLDSPFLAGKKVYRSLLIIPWAIPWAMAAMMWAWTLNSQFGIVNSFLLQTGLVSSPVSFLSTPESAFATTLVIDAWAGMPFMVIMFISGLQSIPSSLYEAARLDGAGSVKQFFKITMPIMKPVTMTVSLLSMVWTFNSFDIIWVLTQGGPIRATETLPIAIYNTSFRMLKFGGIGKASAMTIFQVLIVTFIAVFYIKTMKEGETQ